MELQYLGSDFTMKPDWSIFSKLDHNGGYLHKFPAGSPISHDIGLGLISQVGTLVESSFQHPRHLCSTGSGAVQEAFRCFNKFAGAFYFCLSRASNPKIFHRLSTIAGSSSRVCRSQIKQVTSSMQHLAGLQIGSQVREQHALQMLLARLANATVGRLWNEVEEGHACDILMLAAASVIPPFENIFNDFGKKWWPYQRTCRSTLFGRKTPRLCSCCCAKNNSARRRNGTKNWDQVPYSS